MDESRDVLSRRRRQIGLGRRSAGQARPPTMRPQVGKQAAVPKVAMDGCTLASSLGTIARPTCPTVVEAPGVEDLAGIKDDEPLQRLSKPTSRLVPPRSSHFRSVWQRDGSGISLCVVLCGVFFVLVWSYVVPA